MNDYQTFLDRKSQMGKASGFDPLWVPDFLFDFQRTLVDWAVRKGRAAIFADCGLGKTPMQLVWAQNVVQRMNKPVLVLTPLAVGPQTLLEGEKFGIPCERSRDGLYWKQGIVITNYEKLHLFNSTDFAGVGSEIFGAVRAGRRGIGIELKESYYNQAVKNLDNVDIRDDQLTMALDGEGKDWIEEENGD